MTARCAMIAPLLFVHALAACGGPPSETILGPPEGISVSRSEVLFHDRIEVAAVWEGGGVTEYVSSRHATGRTSPGVVGLRDGEEVVSIPGLGLHDVHAGYAFGVERWPATTIHAVSMSSPDIKTPILSRPGVGIFNVSVVTVGFYWYMAIETDEAIPFSIRFARSTAPDRGWEWLPGIFSPEAYAACPELLYEQGVGFVMLYLRRHAGGWHTEMATSTDLGTWDVRGPLLVAEGDEGVNNSDPDVVRVPGGLWIYYATGDQRTWGNVRRAWWPGTLASLVDAVTRNRQGASSTPPRVASPDAGGTAGDSSNSRR